ncbi:MAG TPA: Lpg1974 family pore-forming outer membrane protein, partial [Rhabdochlamydiaceae bacterium]
KGHIIPDFNTNLLSTVASKSHASNKLNFGTLDFSVGREFFLTKKFAIHPLIGLRGFGMSQNYRARYLSTFTGTAGVPPTTTVNTFFKAKNRTYGVGPRAGIDLKFYMNESWAFLGGLSGALLWGNYRVHQKFQGQESNGTAFVPSVIKTTEKNTSLRTNLDAYFGLGYDVWFNCDNNRFYIAFLFEASEWFAMNQFNDNFSTTPAAGTGSAANITIAGLRRHGDLGFIGGTLHLQIDF